MSLLTLPMELREEIYQLVLVEPTTALRVVANPSYEHAAVQPALCRVSRQLRFETLPIFYSTNTFTMMLLDSRNVRIASRWLRLNQAHVPFLRKLQLRGYCDIAEGMSGGAEVILYQLPLHQPSTVEISVQARTGACEVKAKSASHEVGHPEAGRIEQVVREAWRGDEGWKEPDLQWILHLYASALEFSEGVQWGKEEEGGEGRRLALMSELGREQEMYEARLRVLLERMLNVGGMMQALGLLCG